MGPVEHKKFLFRVAVETGGMGDPARLALAGKDYHTNKRIQSRTWDRPDNNCDCIPTDSLQL